MDFLDALVFSSGLVFASMSFWCFYQMRRMERLKSEAEEYKREYERITWEQIQKKINSQKPRRESFDDFLRRSAALIKETQKRRE